MQRSALTLIGVLATALAACGSGNVKSASDYHAPPPPPVKNPFYDPYTPYGAANATWAAPIYNRAGTIVHPSDPGADQGRPPYEQAPWATGAAGRNTFAPPGTF